MPGAAVLVLLILWRAFAGGPARAADDEERPDEPALRGWFRRQVLFAAFAHALIAPVFVSASAVDSVR